MMDRLKLIQFIPENLIASDTLLMCNFLTFKYPILARHAHAKTVLENVERYNLVRKVDYEKLNVKRDTT